MELEMVPMTRVEGGLSANADGLADHRDEWAESLADRLDYQILNRLF